MMLHTAHFADHQAIVPRLDTKAKLSGCSASHPKPHSSQHCTAGEAHQLQCMSQPVLSTMAVPHRQLSVDRPVAYQQVCPPFVSPSASRCAQQFRQLPNRHTRRKRDACVLQATFGDSQSSHETLQHEGKPSSRMAQTLGNLDALLGIEEEKKDEEEVKTPDAKVSRLH